MRTVGPSIQKMPYPDGFNHEEKLKLAMLWGKHENYDRVRWEFAMFYEINRKPSLIPPRERRGEVPHYPGCEAVACGAVRGRNQWPSLGGVALAGQLPRLDRV